MSIRWLITSFDAWVIGDQMIVKVSTNVPIYMWMDWGTYEPIVVKKYRRQRGIPHPCGAAIRLISEGTTYQQEFGDTYEHTFPYPAWIKDYPHYLRFWATYLGIETISASPIWEMSGPFYYEPWTKGLTGWHSWLDYSDPPPYFGPSKTRLFWSGREAQISDTMGLDLDLLAGDPKSPPIEIPHYFRTNTLCSLQNTDYWIEISLSIKWDALPLYSLTYLTNHPHPEAFPIFYPTSAYWYIGNGTVQRDLRDDWATFQIANGRDPAWQNKYIVYIYLTAFNTTSNPQPATTWQQEYLTFRATRPI